jgi:fatty acid desaturase
MESIPERAHTQDTMEVERNLGFYSKALRPHLDPAIFKPNPARLIGFASCMVAAAGIIAAVLLTNPAWYFKVLAGLGIGFCSGTLGFLCHEILHGSVVKNQKLQDLLFFFGIIPFYISPTYWRYNHNRLHHGHAQKLLTDPDAFPNLRVFKSSKFMKFMFPYTPGSGHKRSVLYFFFWFTLHNNAAQFWMRFRNRQYDEMNHRKVTLELVAMGAIIIAYAALIGPANWLTLFLIPVVTQNYMLMSYIATNHNLSPLTSTNDPLANSLSVTVHPALEFLNANFGYHVEHHLFPTVNPKHAKAIHREIVRQFPETYKIMPKIEAMKQLYRTPRIYKNSHTLVHPETGQTAATL